ncbi:MAG: HemK/PrmC family methyltransferase, partial [Paramuribaculum sp.]
MQQITLDQCRLQAERRLSAVYPPGEARSMVCIIFEQLKGYTPVEMVIRAGDPVSDFIAGKVDEVVGRLLNHEPIQYIFGQTQFYGITLKVNPDVLIPRPETEQLVDMIVADAGRREDLDVLDICTGSGCIAIALTRTLLFPHVTAVDISPAALAVARENVAATRTGVKLLQADALTLPSPAAPEYDIIVSNP